MPIYITKEGYIYSDIAEEIHKFAQGIGLRRSWAKKEGNYIRYMLKTGAKKRQAVKHGALFEKNKNMTVETAIPEHPTKHRKYSGRRYKYRTRALDTVQGNWLRDIRIRHDFTQKELSELTGIPNGTICGIEAGRLTIKSNIAKSLTDAGLVSHQEAYKYVNTKLETVRSTIKKAEQPKQAFSLAMYSTEEIEEELQKRRKLKEIIEPLQQRLKEINDAKLAIEEEEARLNQQLKELS